MSEKFANFALSQESDNISNFSGSVSQKLEIENVGNFLLTHAISAWAVILHSFRQLVSYDHLSRECDFRPRFFYYSGKIGLAYQLKTWQMKKILLIIIVLLSCFSAALADPGTRLGESLSVVQSEVQGLRHLRNWPTKGDQYTVYHDTNAYTSYYFKNNRVVLEEFTCSGNEETAGYYFDRFVSDFSKQNYINAYEGDNSVTFYFSRIKVTVSLSHFVGNEYLCKVSYTSR